MTLGVACHSPHVLTETIGFGNTVVTLAVWGMALNILLIQLIGLMCSEGNRVGEQGH